MTDEERKQFINEYCRNVGNIKIKCDDCKLVEDCLEYVLDGFRKFTPKPSEPMTNEEWFNSLQTSDKAKYIAKAMYFYDMGMPMGEALRASIRHEQGLNRTLENDVIEWLKQPHKE